ncbi:hypothetical protein EGY25_08890 [Brevundimonas intermedia]|uniref:Uncharacterized protein n=1 Tax=Brevundimonas intermedia TaxID=74315 RepID=A0A4Y9RWG9_9CAUL|nr:AAA family ATPase [Brevundimonas intermedia]TFW12155.1 hypothetical protein EGY25_08890 [Brevundimonas intermedia]
MVLPPKPPPEEPDKEPPKPPAERLNPLVQHSLRGDAAKLHARAVDTIPLLGGIMFLGQATIIYAPPNAGKTLLVTRFIKDAIEEGRLDPNKLFYINADDSGKGLAVKVEILELLNAHMLAPGLKGFKASQFVDKLIEATQDGTARGSVVIIDTLKKFTNLMDKARSSNFANVCREYVMAGGTIIALGHTAKNRNADGSLRYQGTTDILEDFDAAYVAEPMTGSAGASERVVRFTQQKSRADSPQEVAYAYSTEQGLTYVEKVASVRPVYSEELEGHTLEAGQLDDDQVIAAIRSFLAQGHGHVGQDRLVKAMAVNGDISRAQAHRVLDKYTGSDPERHHWNYDKGARGKRSYYLLTDRPAEGTTTPTP